MDPTTINPTPLLGASAAADLSIWQLILHADAIVKVVMLLLLMASVWCWAIIFEKQLRFTRLRRKARAFEEAFWSGGSLEALYDEVGNEPDDPLSAIFSAAMKEWRHAMDRGLTATSQMRVGLQQRIERVMQVTQARELGRLEARMTFLASTGSTAPFIGLFGTVWGIMNSFQSIAAEANTSLSVVAPGIAEALFATALGLFAAVPASAAYNKFASDLGRYTDRLDSFSGEFAAILSRHLEERG